MLTGRGEISPRPVNIHSNAFGILTIMLALNLSSNLRRLLI